MGLGSVIRTRRKENGLTQDQVASAAGISKPYLSNIENSKTRNPPSDQVLRQIEGVLDFLPDQLTGLAHREKTPVDIRQELEALQAQVANLQGVVKAFLASDMPGPQGVDLRSLAENLHNSENSSKLDAAGNVPVVNKVEAGYPKQFGDLNYPPNVANEYIRCPDIHDSQAFAARVVGDSMEPDYHEGDIVIFAPNAQATEGCDCFVKFDDGRTTFTRIFFDNTLNIRLQPINNRYPAEIIQRPQAIGLWPAAMRVQHLLPK